jgi:hypothetical protein
VSAITIDRALLEQALEALEPMQNNRDDTAIQRAITALRAALAQEEQEPGAWRDPATDDIVSVARRAAWETDYGLGGKGRAATYTEPLYARPPRRETEQEPVAWTDRELELIDGMIEVQLRHASQCDGIANRTMAEKQKGWDMERVALLQKIKSNPPRREWQSLTEEEIAKVWCGAVMAQSTKEPGLGVIGFARAIEAKLKEKNS